MELVAQGNQRQDTESAAMLAAPVEVRKPQNLGLSDIQVTTINNQSLSQSQFRPSSRKEMFRSKLGEQNPSMLSKVDNENQYDISTYLLKQEINYSSFKKKIDDLHMRKRTETSQLVNYTCADVVCRTSMPGHCCCWTSEKTAVDELGVGVTLYFKQLRHLIWNYLFFTIISLPILFFSVYASKDNSQSISTFQDLLQITTVGNIGQDARQCFKDSFSSATLSYDLKCYSGTLAMSSSLAWGYIPSTDTLDYKEQDCSYLDSTTPKKDQNAQKSTLSKISDCEGETSCVFTKADVLLLFKPTIDTADKQFYVTAYCQGTSYKFGGYEFQKKYVAYIVSGIDAFIVLWFFLMVYLQGRADNKSIDYILKQRRTPAHFTVQVTNLPSKINSEEELMADLHEHIEKAAKQVAKRERYNDSELRVVDVKISESQKEIQQQRQKGIIKKENYNKIYKFLLKYDPEKKTITNFSLITIEGLRNLAESLEDAKLKKSALKDLAVIESAYVKIGQAMVSIEKIEASSSIKYAWVTFANIKSRNFVEDKLSSTSFEKCLGVVCGCCDCCKPQEKVFKNKILSIDAAPNPDSILWENNDSKFLFFRRIISIAITVLILAGSYVLIVWIRNKKQDIQKKYPSVDCSLSLFDNITGAAGMANVIAESNLSSSEVKVGYIQCYCKKFVDEIFSSSLAQPYQSICNDWLQDYTLAKFLPYAAVICIIIINMIMQFIFIALSQFEKYKLFDHELKSRILKNFVAQFINTGLILLLTNINFDVNTSGLSFLFGGSYTDLSPQWFKNVGTVIILTLLINVASTPIIALIFTLLRRCARCRDRGCSKDKTKTKKQTLTEWVDYYTGPEFLISFRYSQILGICFIGMLYSGGIPILYFTSFLHLLVLYWVDKLNIFRVCKKPLNYNESMQEMVRNILYLVPFIHTIFSIYIYGNTDIFFEISYIDDPMFNLSSSNAVVQKFIERVLTRQQNYAHAIILAVLLVLFLLRFFLLKPLKWVFQLCLEKTGAKKYLADNAAQANLLKEPYYNFLGTTQLKDEVEQIKHYEVILGGEQGNGKKSEKYLQYLAERKQDCENTRTQQGGAEIPSRMIGVFSYDIRHNPIYKKLYQKWEKIPGTPLKKN